MIWLAEEATATGGVTPRNIKRGVAIKPPPIPNTPDKIPPVNPMNSKEKILIGISAIGK